MKYINKEKIEKIKLNKNNFYVAIDFDRTLTSKESCDSWDACGFLLGEDYKKESYELYQKYSPIELNYTISFEAKNKAMEEWYYGAMNLYYKYNLTQDLLIESINKSNLIFRQGAKEFLEDMHKNNIPVVILSAGIGNVIEQFFKNNNCLYNNIFIISNFIEFDKNGNIKEYNGHLIHTLNKTMEGHITPELEDTIKGREYRLLFGDFIEDKKIIPMKEWDRTISIRFFRKKCRTKLRCI